MIKENRIVSTCGIMALIPDEDDSDVVVEYYNRVLNNYGGNLRAFMMRNWILITQYLKK